MSVDETTCVLQMTRQPLSLDQPVGEHDDTYFGEFLEDYREDDPLLEMNQDMLKSRIADVLQSLDYREREILRLRYGLADGYAYTLEEVGKIFSVTRERVRQIETKAVKALQHPVRARQLSGFLDDARRRAAAGRQLCRPRPRRWPRSWEKRPGRWKACDWRFRARCRVGPDRAASRRPTTNGRRPEQACAVPAESEQSRWRRESGCVANVGHA